MNKQIKREILTRERSLFHENNINIDETIFDQGESPLKECNNVFVQNSMFKYKYPFWYSNNINVDNSTWFEQGRAGVWYSNNVHITNSIIEAPKNFRRCNNIKLENINMPNALETLWNCHNVNLNHINAQGEYFLMNCYDVAVEDLNLIGNYPFDGCKNVTVKNSHLLSKDAFWNCEKVTVENCFISGEYLGWNSKDVTFINCTIESLQGLCYIENLKMINCTLLNTNLAFEYSTLDVEVHGKIISILNPKSGIIKADEIDNLILEKDKINPKNTKIICNKINHTYDKVNYEEMF